MIGYLAKFGALRLNRDHVMTSSLKKERSQPVGPYARSYTFFLSVRLTFHGSMTCAFSKTLKISYEILSSPLNNKEAARLNHLLALKNQVSTLFRNLLATSKNADK